MTASAAPSTVARASVLTVDDLVFEVRRSARRKTVGLTVDRRGELIVAAPMDCARSVLEDFVREKRFWIYSKLASKDLLDQPRAARQFVSGEAFHYLGRGYRLLLVDEQDVPLKLVHGRFRLLRRDTAAGREHFIRWYSAHAQPWLSRRLGGFVRRIGVDLPRVRVLDLGFRWGSCVDGGSSDQGGGVNFHWAVILLPPTIIDYVIVHELVHLHEPRHTAEFWRRVERAMPDYERRKKWLAERGGSHLALS